MEKRLNSNHLKLIAIIAMTVDHFTDLFYPGFPIAVLPITMHLIGRLTAPIMWFFIAEGYHYTKNIRKYMFRLGLFGGHLAFRILFCIWNQYHPVQDRHIQSDKRDVSAFYRSSGHVA